MVNKHSQTEHIPVMLNECLDGLAIKDGGVYVDCTVGGAGHSSAIMKKAKDVRLIGFDADPSNYKKASDRLAEYGDRVRVVNTNFQNLRNTVRKIGWAPVDGILFDLGLSSMQLSEDGAGFSFQYDAPLDMRFSPDQSLSAYDIVNSYSEQDIADILYEYGEEPKSRRIARAIVEARPVETTVQLAEIIAKAAGEHGKIHPATRSFQALRIAVNNELEVLRDALEQSVDILAENGRLVVMSYHSLEDRIVKNFIRDKSKTCVCPPDIPVCVCNTVPTLSPVTKKAIAPSPEEEKVNPRSRSAKLRIAERINTEMSSLSMTSLN
jgi:16S rRNA (cytosine1402-N4)-methyltransferase